MNDPILFPLLLKGPIMRTTITTIISATVLSTAVLCAPPAVADWSPPFDPTHDVTREVLRWVPKVGPASSVGSVREVRKVRTVRKVGEQR